jgi:sugar lactone lactonase YvrE
VAIEKSGDIWLSVQPKCEVRRYTPSGEETFRVQLVTPAQGCLAGNGLAVTPDGTLFAAVFSWNPDTRGVYMVGRDGPGRHIPGSGQIVYPNAIALDDGNGELYVTDMIGGAIWRIGHDETVERWAWGPALTGNLPLPPGFPQGNPLGANGIALRHDALYVAVTFAPRIVRVPVNPDGSAGMPEVVVPPPALLGAGIFALDGLALDVHGNFYVASPSLPGVVRIADDGSEVSRLGGPAEGITASALSLAFGTGKGDRQHLFVTISPTTGGVGSGLVRVLAGAPGMPLP